MVVQRESARQIIAECKEVGILIVAGGPLFTSEYDQFESTGDLLTVREIEVIQMVAAGYSNSRIAEELFISPQTVKTHLYNIYKTIIVPSRLQAALWAVKNL